MIKIHYKKPYTPKPLEFEMTDPFIRWRAFITYRFDHGLETISYDLEEMYELHDIVEAVHWDTIAEIKIERVSLPGLENLTVEQAELM